MSTVVPEPQEIVGVREHILSLQVAGEVERWVRKPITKLFSRLFSRWKSFHKIPMAPSGTLDWADSYGES